MDPIDFVTIKGASDATKLSQLAIRRAIKDGRLRAVRPAGVKAVRIPVVALHEFMGARPPKKSLARETPEGRARRS